MMASLARFHVLWAQPLPFTLCVSLLGPTKSPSQSPISILPQMLGLAVFSCSDQALLPALPTLLQPSDFQILGSPTIQPSSFYQCLEAGLQGCCCLPLLLECFLICSEYPTIPSGPSHATSSLSFSSPPGTVYPFPISSPSLPALT